MILKGIGGPYLTENGSPLLDSREADLYKSADIDFIRIKFSMPAKYSMQKWDKNLLAQYQSLVGYFHEKLDIRTIGILDSNIVPNAVQSNWNSTDDQFNSFYRTYIYNAGLIIEGLPEVKEWEVWNEPNSYTHNDHGSLSGGTYIRPSRLAALIHSIYPIANKTKSILITGGLFMHNLHGELSLGSSGAAYLNSLLFCFDEPFKEFYAIGIHPYIDQPGQFATGHFQSELKFYEEIMTKWKCKKDLWITEFGWDIKSVSEAQQSKNIQELFTFVDSYGKIPVVIYFELEDSPFSNLHYGLANSEGEIRPAFSTFKQLH